MSAHACRDAEWLSDDSRWFLVAQLRGPLCAAKASRSSSSFFRITLPPRISGGRWRYMRGKQTISTSSVAPPTADQPLVTPRNLPRVWALRVGRFSSYIATPRAALAGLQVWPQLATTAAR
eukprot:COSAG06_NODE_64_length_26790_cov_7.462291_22_plen_121_part_00